MKYLRELFMSRDFLELKPCSELLSKNYGGANYITAARGLNYAYIYTPNGLDIGVNMGILDGCDITAGWFDPRTGAYIYAGKYKNAGVFNFAPPSSGRNSDWVLILSAS